MKHFNYLWLLVWALSIPLVFISCEKDEPFPLERELPSLASGYGSDIVLRWNSLLLDVERYSRGYRPPVSARAFAYISLAAYEAAVPGMPEHRSMSGALTGLQLPQVEAGYDYHWPTCVNEAYATIVHRFFPHTPPQWQAALYALEFQIKDELTTLLAGRGEIYDRSKAFGRAIGEAVFAWSATDAAGHEAYLRNADPAYLPNPAGIAGQWVPTPPNYMPALLPNWGKVRPFALRNNELLGLPPLVYSSDVGSPYYQEAMEVYQTTRNLSEEQKWIAIFWSDDVPELTFTPAARWYAIANQVAGAEQPSLDKALELYAKLGMALADAGISCWFSKYYYNVERPVTFINRVIDPAWRTPLFVGTPPFPAYPSGHSTFGGAAAVILTDLFGANYAMTDRCHEGRTEFDGRPRSFLSFAQMAGENAFSRIPLGVHFRMDCVEGLRMGEAAGNKVLALPWKK